MEAIEQEIEARFKIGSTLTANVNDGVRFCDMAMVKADLQERNVVCKRGVTNDNLRTKLKRVLRGEGEWQGTIMYRRDQRFTIRDHDASHKAELDRTICNSALCDAS